MRALALSALLLAVSSAAWVPPAQAVEQPGQAQSPTADVAAGQSPKNGAAEPSGGGLMPADAEGWPANLQACRNELQDLMSWATSDQYKNPLLPRRDLRTLRDAALVFARAGDGDGCHEINEQLRGLLKKQEEQRQQVQRQQRLQSAVTLAKFPKSLRASNMIGADVVNSHGQALGTIEDIVLGADGQRYVLVQHGGFLGFGENLTPIGMERVRVTGDGDTFVADIDEQIFSQAPTVTNAAIPPEDWRRIDEWWRRQAQR